jgi:hypothetical protein
MAYFCAPPNIGGPETGLLFSAMAAALDGALVRGGNAAV